MPPEQTWAPAGSQPAASEEPVELLSEEEAGALSDEEKDFRASVGVPENAKAHPSWDNKRFRQVYAKSKQTERENAQLRQDMKAALEHSKRTAEAMENLAKVQTTAVTSDIQKKADTIQGELQDMEQDLSGIADQKRTIRRNKEMDEDSKWDAIEALEKKEKALEKQIARKTTEAESAIREAKDAEKAAKAKPATETTETPDRVAVKEFVQAVEWFNPRAEEYDPVMAAAAEKYDAALLLKDEWGAGKATSLQNNRDRLKKVKEYIEKRFDWKGEETTPARHGFRMVEGVGDTTHERGTNGAVKLNDLQKSVAHNMFPDLAPPKAEAEYAKNIGRA